MNSINQLLSSITPSNSKFANSVFRDWSMTQPTRKGHYGELIAKEMLAENGYEITERTTKEHDYICNGKKIELKTGFLKEDDKECFTFYGYDATEDPHFWDFQFVYPEEIFIVRMDRNSMANIYLGKTRKNTMFTTNLEQMLEAGGKTIAYYSVS